MKNFNALYKWVVVRRSLAAANAMRDRWQIKQTEADKLSTLLSIGFIWFSDTSPYGVSFWQGVHKQLKAEEADQ